MQKIKTADKTEEQLLKELSEIRQRITELEKSETRYRQTEEALKEAYDKLELRVVERTAELKVSNEQMLFIKRESLKKD